MPFDYQCLLLSFFVLLLRQSYFFSPVCSIAHNDSREMISQFIQWANEFEYLHKHIEWGVNSPLDYIDSPSIVQECSLKKGKLAQDWGVSIVHSHLVQHKSKANPHKYPIHKTCPAYLRYHPFHFIVKP